MCGVTGIIAADRREDVTSQLERLTALLQHRGPDGAGFRYFHGRSIGLGHRRLSILDLETGDQPMANEDDTVWVSYNGEIYNHLVLRRELESRGHRFRTNADTEVLVHGWEEWGPESFERLNGIFAIALYDGRTSPGKVWLARDPVGAKPLYVGWNDAGYWFASELNAARQAGLVASDLRPGAFDEFLVYRFVPSPGTFFQRVSKLPPGHYCCLDLARPIAEPAFEPYRARFTLSRLPRNQGEWAEAIRGGLSAAVRRQLMSDVPVGSLLSGGVDSTIVTGLMRDGLQAPPHSFAVGLDGEGAVNELIQARLAAAALGVPLSEVIVNDTEFLAAWPAQVMSLGEPIANSGVLLLGLLCRTVKKTHKVVLTGQGADEPLGGYPRHSGERWYPWMSPASMLLGLVPERWAASDRVERVRRLVNEPEQARRFAEILAVFSPSAVGNMTGHGTDADSLVAPIRRWLPESNGDSLNSLLAVDARLSLADDLLLVADHVSMASSVELRVPFLDLEFLALLEAMPSSYKISAFGGRKWLYRRAVAGLLPPSLRRPLTGLRARTGKKLGFTTPIDRWLGRWSEQQAEQYLLGREAMTPHHLKAGAVRGVLDESRAGRPRSRQLLSLYVLETWLRGTFAL